MNPSQHKSASPLSKENDQTIVNNTYFKVKCEFEDDSFTVVNNDRMSELSSMSEITEQCKVDEIFSVASSNSPRTNATTNQSENEIGDSFDVETIGLKRRRRTPVLYMLEDFSKRRRQSENTEYQTTDTDGPFLSSTSSISNASFNKKSVTSDNHRSQQHDNNNNDSSQQYLSDIVHSSSNCHCMEEIKAMIRQSHKLVLNEISLNRRLIQENSRLLSAMSINRGIKLDLPCPLPLQSMEDFNQVDKWAENDENRKNLAKQLSLVGGTSVNDVCRRVIRRLMAPELAVQFSFTGRKATKLAFNTSSLCLVAQLAVQFTNNIFTEKNIDDGFKDVFRHSRDRLNRMKSS